MSHDAKTQAVLAFLRSQAEALPALAPQLQQMEELYSRKLWHQLTVLLQSFISLPEVQPLLIHFYESFVCDFKQKLNKLALAKIQIAVAQQYSEVEKVIFFGNSVAAEARKDDVEAHTFILCEIARMLLSFEKVAECKERLDEAATFMQSTAGVDICVQASYYRAWSAYYKIKGPATDFYKNALLLLAYSPLSEVPASPAHLRRLARRADEGLHVSLTKARVCR